MKFILSYKIFEEVISKAQDFEWSSLSFSEKKSKLFAIYSPIPLEKRSAASVIKKIRFVNGIESNKIDDYEIKFPNKRLIDRLRWHQYFTSLIESKDIRGHNFEGLIAGLYDGELTKRGDRGDLKIGDKVISVKSLNNKYEAPVLGSIKKSLSDEQIARIGNRTIRDIFDTKSGEDEEFKREIWDASFVRGNNKIDYFLISYFVEPSKESSGTIFIFIFSNDEMYNFIQTNGLAVQKRSESRYQMRIPASYRYENPISIKVPEITDNDLDQIWNAEARNWANYVFGNAISKRMRTDTIENILKDKGDISKRMEES